MLFRDELNKQWSWRSRGRGMRWKKVGNFKKWGAWGIIYKSESKRLTNLLGIYCCARRWLGTCASVSSPLSATLATSSRPLLTLTGFVYVRPQPLSSGTSSTTSTQLFPLLPRVAWPRDQFPSKWGHPTTLQLSSLRLFRRRAGLLYHLPVGLLKLGRRRDVLHNLLRRCRLSTFLAQKKRVFDFAWTTTPASLFCGKLRQSYQAVTPFFVLRNWLLIFRIFWENSNLACLTPFPLPLWLRPLLFATKPKQFMSLLCLFTMCQSSSLFTKMSLCSWWIE